MTNETEARTQDGLALRTAAETMYQRIMRVHEDAIGAGDAHQWWHNLEAQWRSLGAALDFAYGALPPSAPPALDDLTREHRKCGPKYEGCYAHWPMDHCRADGTPWPCDVEHIRARIADQIGVGL